jgi:hypothetical protein
MEQIGREKWHLKKEISLGDVIAIVISITAILGAYARLDTRVSLLEQSQNYTKAAFEKIDASIERLSSKIDRLIERGNGKP